MQRLGALQCYLVFGSVSWSAFRAEVFSMSDGGSGQRCSSLVRSADWYCFCWLKRAKEVRTVDAGPSPS